MEYNLVATDSNFNMVMLSELRDQKQSIINHMVENEKTFIRYKGLFINLVHCETVNSDKS